MSLSSQELNYPQLYPTLQPDESDHLVDLSSKIKLAEQLLYVDDSHYIPDVQKFLDLLCSRFGIMKTKPNHNNSETYNQSSVNELKPTVPPTAPDYDIQTEDMGIAKLLEEQDAKLKLESTEIKLLKEHNQDLKMDLKDIKKELKATKKELRAELGLESAELTKLQTVSKHTNQSWWYTNYVGWGSHQPAINNSYFYPATVVLQDRQSVRSINTKKEDDSEEDDGSLILQVIAFLGGLAVAGAGVYYMAKDSGEEMQVNEIDEACQAMDKTLSQIYKHNYLVCNSKVYIKLNELKNTWITYRERTKRHNSQQSLNKKLIWMPITGLALISAFSPTLVNRVSLLGLGAVFSWGTLSYIYNSTMYQLTGEKKNEADTYRIKDLLSE